MRLESQKRQHPVSDCILHEGTVVANGYGRVNSEYAHRVAYEEIHGPIPEGKLVRHLCNVKLCVNVEHLALGTRVENYADARKIGAHAHGSRNGQARLTEEDIATIRELGKTVAQHVIGTMYGVHQSTIGRVLAGIHWSHA